MTLYTISAILVIEMVKDNSNIKGHTTKHNKIKIQCYADDMTIIMEQPKEIEAIRTIYQELKSIQKQNNEENTQILKLGNKNNKAEEKKYNIDDKIKSQVTVL